MLNLTVNEYQPFSGINTDRNPYLLLDRSIIEKIYLHSGESILYITGTKDTISDLATDRFPIFLSLDLSIQQMKEG